jgi:hypothetical protein
MRTWESSLETWEILLGTQSCPCENTRKLNSGGKLETYMTTKAFAY